MGQIAAGLHDQRAGAQEQRRPGRIGGRSHQHGPGMASPAAGSRATRRGRAHGRPPLACRAICRRRDRFRHPRARRGRPARRRRFPPPRPGLPRPPIVAAVSCATRRAGPPSAGSAPSARASNSSTLRWNTSSGAARPPGPRSVRPAPARSAWRRRRSRPARCAASRWRQSNRAPAISSRASALPARQRRVQRPPGRRGGLLARTQRGRVGADQVQHAVQQIIRRFAPARMTQIGFVDGAMAVALQEVREGAAERAIWRQRVAPVRAAPARSQASAAASSRASAARSISA